MALRPPITHWRYTINSLNIIGRVCDGIETKNLASGRMLTRMKIAVRSRPKLPNGDRPTDLFSCEAWGNAAEYAAQFIRQGQLVSITGRLENREWTNSSGATIRENVIVITELHVMEKSFVNPGGQDNAL